MRGSELRTKLLMWVPIFIIFIVFIGSNQFFQVLVTLYLTYHIFREARTAMKKGYPFMITYYALLVGFGLVSVWLMSSLSINTTFGLIFAAMLADELGYYGDSLSTKKKIGKANILRTKKGILGQLVGASLGAVLSYIVVGQFDLWIIVPIFIGVVIGDTINRFIKSELKIKSWSNKIKGHGGYLDRFACLSFAALAVYLSYFI